MSSIKKAFPFWILRWACLEVNWPQTCTLSLQTNISTCTIHLLIQTLPNFPLFLVKHWGLAGYAIIKQILKDIWTIWRHGSKQEAILNIKPKRKWAKFDLIKNSNTKQSKSKGVTFAVIYQLLLKSFLEFD